MKDLFSIFFLCLSLSVMGQSPMVMRPDTESPSAGFMKKMLTCDEKDSVIVRQQLKIDSLEIDLQKAILLLLRQNVMTNNHIKICPLLKKK